MKSRSLLITIVLLACLGGYLWFTYTPRSAYGINTYDQEAVIRIDIEDIRNGRTLTIIQKDQISTVISTLKNNYEVRKIPKFRETDLFIKNPIRYSAVFFNGNYEVVDQYFVTAFDTIVVLNLKTMVGNNRTGTYESTTEQKTIIENLRRQLETLDTDI